MDDTIRRLAKVLGGVGLESVGHDVRFSVEGGDGSRLDMVIEGNHQRLIATLHDAKGVVRAGLDLAPIRKVTEDPGISGRVALHIGATRVNIDTKPNLAIGLVSERE